MEYNDINKIKTDYNNESSKEFKKMKKDNTIKNIPYHESFFEYVNPSANPPKSNGICAEFKNVRFYNTKFNEETLRKLLDFAIEHYLQYAPLKKVDVNDFIKYANSEFNAQIFSIDSIELKMTRSLERTIDDNKNEQRRPPENVLELVVEYPKEVQKPNKPSRPIEIPGEKIYEMPSNIPVEMPMRTIKEMPSNNIPVEMPDRKPEEIKTRDHTPQYQEPEMGM